MESSPPFELEQSLPICCSLAVIGGILEVFATAVTAVPSVRQAQGQDMRPLVYYAALAGNVSLQLTGSILSHLVATWFGPVSIVVPFFYASTLLSNMAIFGWLLGLEFFSKIMRVGTFVIVVAVILLPVVGPDVQEDQDINDLLHHSYSMLWFGFLLVAMTITGLLVGLTDITTYPMPTRILILLVARASSISLNLTVSRGFICHPTHAMFVFFLVLKIVSGAVYCYAIVVQSTAVDQAKFVPLNTTTIIVANAVTGILIWADYNVISSWYGYACIFVLLWLGCDLLLSTPVSLLTEDNPRYGVVKKASAILRRKSADGLGCYSNHTTLTGMANSGRHSNGGYRSIPDLEYHNSITETGHEYMFEDPDDATGFEATERSYREVWRDITLAEIPCAPTTAYTFASTMRSASQTATQSYQQGVAALARASSALSYTGQQASKTLLSSSAAIASALSSSVTGSAVTETTTNPPSPLAAKGSRTACADDGMTPPSSPPRKKRKKGFVKKTISVLKHPRRLFLPKSSKRKQHPEPKAVLEAVRQAEGLEEDPRDRNGEDDGYPDCCSPKDPPLDGEHDERYRPAPE